MWKIFIKACILFNYLSIKFFVLLNATFLFLGSLSYVFRVQVNMTLYINTNERERKSNDTYE
jgi:hypothetical protein